MSLIQTRGLTKSFEVRRGKQKFTVAAVQNMDIEVAEGEIVSFLGPNGAGKTTALRMLTTLTAPTAGSAFVAGHDIATAPRRVRAEIGYVSQRGTAASFAKVEDELVDRAMLYGLQRSVARSRAGELLDMFELGEARERMVVTLSGGQRRRLDVAMGLVHRPRLLFLDEPSTGLDPQARANMWDHVAGLRERHGMTVFMTTHYLDEADALSDRVIVIDHGRIVATGTPSQLKDQYESDRVTLTVRAADDLDVVVRALAAVAATAPVVEALTVTAPVFDTGRRVAALIRTLDAEHVELAAIEVSRPTLDDVFLRITGRALRETGKSGGWV